MTARLLTFFGLTVPVSDFPVAPDTARALARRLSEAAKAMNDEEVPVALAAEFRRDAERYLALRRTRELRLPASLERGCDEHAHALMHFTANTPPRLNVPERMVA